MSDALEEVSTLKQHVLKGASITVGRDPTTDLVLDDASVSRRHCTFTKKGDEWWLSDEGSRNGTEVEGRRISTPVLVRANARIRIGQVELVLRVGARPTTAPAVTTASIPVASAIAAAPRKAEHFATQEFSIEQFLPNTALASREAVLTELMFKAQAAFFPGQPIDNLLESILDLTLRYVPASRASVQLWSPESERLEPGLTLDHQGSSHVTMRDFVMSTGVAEKVMRDRKAVLIRDVLSDEEFKSRKSLVRSGITSAVAAPIFDGNDILGVLYADLRQSAAELDEAHVAYISVLAAMGGTSLVAAQMISALMRNEAELREENTDLKTRLQALEP